MRLIFTSIIFVFHLLCLEACRVEEFENKGECCPRCGTGERVYEPCTTSTSTSCIPCIEGTYMDHPNGLSNCFPCRSCDSGSNLIIKERCTYEKNTVCSCASGYYCTFFSGEDCELCQKHTIAQPGYMVTQAGTGTTDTQFVPCPPGTFSTEAMSFSCKPWTNCSEAGGMEEKAGTTTSDAICKKPPTDEDKDNQSHIIAFLVPSLFVLSLVSALAFFFWRKKRKSERTALDKQEEEAEKVHLRVPVPETNMVEPIQETTQNGSEPAYRAV